MEKTCVINMKFCRDLEVVPIDRTTVFGNPYKIGRDGNREKVLEKYKKYFHIRLAKDNKFVKQVEELRGKKLGCWCKPLPCHGDEIVNYLEGSNQ